MYLVESSHSPTFRVEGDSILYQVFRQLFMISGKSETGHVSECSGHENLPSAGLWAPLAIHDPAPASRGSQRLSPHSRAPCTGAVSPEKDSRLHRTSRISMAAEVSNTLSYKMQSIEHKIALNEGFFIQPVLTDFL